MYNTSMLKTIMVNILQKDLGNAMVVQYYGKNISLRNLKRFCLLPFHG